MFQFLNVKGNKNGWRNTRKLLRHLIFFESEKFEGIKESQKGLVGKSSSTESLPIFFRFNRNHSATVFLDRKCGPGILGYLWATCLKWPSSVAVGQGTGITPDPRCTVARQPSLVLADWDPEFSSIPGAQCEIA